MISDNDNDDLNVLNGIFFLTKVFKIVCLFWQVNEVFEMSRLLFILFSLLLLREVLCLIHIKIVINTT